MASDSKKASRRGDERPPTAEGVADGPPPPFRRRETALIAGLAVGWLIYVLWNALGPRGGAETTATTSPVAAATASAAPSSAPSRSGPEVDADLFAHDVVAGLIILQREGPAELRATREQRVQLEAAWPDAKKNLENNSTRPSPADAKMRVILTPVQKEAIRKLAASGQLVLPPHLKVYVPQFERLLAGAPIVAPSADPSKVATAGADHSPRPADSGAPVVSPSGSPSVGASVTPVVNPSGAPATSPSGMPTVNASGVPAGNPGEVVDPYLDLFLHDMVGGVIALQENGPEILQLTPSQREALTALQPKIARRLDANDPRPTALDEQMRAILTPEQKAAIRTLVSTGKVHLPPSLAEYVKPFALLLAGKYTKGAMPSPTAAPPGTPSGAPGAPTGGPASGKSTPGAKQPAEEPFDDIFLHDAVGGLIAIRRDGPAPLRLSAAQRKQLETLWPDIRKRLEANDWKPSALDAKIVGVLTPRQRAALRALRGSGKVPPPPKLNAYIAPFEAMLKKP